MQVKTNAYSDELAHALEAVAQISHPDYTKIPIEPTAAMVEAAVTTTGLSEEEVRRLYTAMLLAWSGA